MIWKTTNNRFVAFFDILGFKDLVYRNSHETVLRKMNNLNKIIAPLETEAKKILAQESSLNVSKIEEILHTIARPVIFSDSILIVTNGNSLIEAHKITIIAGWVINECFKKGIPIKGSISYGKMTADFDRSIYFGQPLIDAYLLQDELQMYGVIFDNNFEAFFHRKKMAVNSKYWSTYKAPLKTGRVKHLILNWHSNEKEFKKSRIYIKEFYKYVSGKPRIYVDNTEEYLDFLSNHI